MAEASPQIKAVVYQAIAHLESRGASGVAERIEIGHLTGMQDTMHLVDGAIKSLIDDDKSVQRLRGGVFKTVTHFPYQLLYISHQQDGRVKLEVDDTVTLLTPLSASVIGTQFAGYAMYPGRFQATHRSQRPMMPSLPLFG